MAGSYAAWCAGLRVNLAANRALLERTGVSTNVLSKAAHDLVRTRGGGMRARRFAASAGYVVTELAKEAPYYAGASGAVFLTDSVTASDALIFLGGANLGAAAYEYGLARATRGFLRRRSALRGKAEAADHVQLLAGELAGEQRHRLADRGLDPR